MLVNRGAQIVNFDLHQFADIYSSVPNAGPKIHVRSPLGLERYRYRADTCDIGIEPILKKVSLPIPG